MNLVHTPSFPGDPLCELESRSRLEALPEASVTDASQLQSIFMTVEVKHCGQCLEKHPTPWALGVI